MRRSLATALVVLTAGTAGAATGEPALGGARFAQEIETRGERLTLHGAGVLRYRGILRAYAAALYLPPGIGAERALDDVTKRLEIEYFWSIDAASFGQAADALLAERLAPDALARLRSRLDLLHARYESVRPGDRYALTYLPDVGTELSKNGRPLAVVPGSDFAGAYFALWLGDPPMDAGLREALRTSLPDRARN